VIGYPRFIIYFGKRNIVHIYEGDSKELFMAEKIEDEVLAIELGVFFIPRVEKIVSGIDMIRKKNYRITNFEIPRVRIMDNKKIENDSYRIWLNGKIVKTRRVRIMRIRRILTDFENLIKLNLDKLKQLQG
jgi:flagellar biosynthesis component FlhA